MKTKGLWLFLGLICLVFLSAAQPCLAAEPKILEVGGLFCLTGFGSSAEVLNAQGVQLGVDWVNDNGGLTIKGEKYMLKLILEDIKGTADGAAAGATKLVHDQKVKFILGGVIPFMVQAAGTVTEPAKVLRVLAYDAGVPGAYGPKTPYSFLGNNATIEGMQSSLNYVKEAYPQVKSVTFVIPDDGSVPTLDKLFRKMASNLGIGVKATEKWAMSTEEFTPIITKVLSHKADAIGIANAHPQFSGSMLKISREMGFKGLVFGGNFDDAYQLSDIAGREASTNFFIHQLDLDSPEMTPIIKEVVKRAKAKYGRPFGFHAMQFGLVYVFKQAIEKAQSLDPTVVRDTWEKMTTIDTIYGPGRMGGLKTYGINHTVCSPCPIVTLTNGEVKWAKWDKNVYSP